MRNLKQEKDSLRETLKSLRKQNVSLIGQKEVFSTSFEATLDKILFPFMKQGVFLYYPLQGEPLIDSFVGYCQKREGQLFLPRLKEDHTLEIVSWSGHKGELAKSNIKGLWQPEESIPSIPICRAPKVWLVPGLGFDQRGGRLGFGAGFYDRLIRSARDFSNDFLVLGVCYSWQIVESISVEAHDQLMDGLIVDWQTLNPCFGQ